MLAKAGKKAVSYARKNPLIVGAGVVGTILLYRWIFGKEKVGKPIVIKGGLTPTVDHNELAQRLFSNMEGFNVIPATQEWFEILQLPTSQDVAEVYKLFNERASEEGYDSEETLTNWIENEFTMPTAPSTDIKEATLKRLRSLGLN